MGQFWSMHTAYSIRLHEFAILVEKLHFWGFFSSSLVCLIRISYRQWSKSQHSDFLGKHWFWISIRFTFFLLLFFFFTWKLSFIYRIYVLFWQFISWFVKYRKQRKTKINITNPNYYEQNWFLDLSDFHSEKSNKKKHRQVKIKLCWLHWQYWMKNILRKRSIE